MSRTPPTISVGGITVEGTDGVRREAGGRIREVFRAGVGRAYVEAEIVMTESKRRTPVKDGHLRRSGHVAPPKQTADGVAIDLTYGDEAVDYAIHVHEDLEALHKVGEAKFLEGPLREATGRIRDNVVAAMRGALAKR